MLESALLLCDVGRVCGHCLSGAQVTPADVSAGCMLSRGIASFSRKTVQYKYLNGSRRMGVSKEPSYLFASEVISSMAAVVGWLAGVSSGLAASEALFSSPCFSFVCRPRGVGERLGREASIWCHRVVERVSALGRGCTGRSSGA